MRLLAPDKGQTLGRIEVTHSIMNKLDLCKKLAGIDLPKSNVAFHFADKALEQLLAKAERLASENVRQFFPGERWHRPSHHGLAHAAAREHDGL